jgi:hypothetical protein
MMSDIHTKARLKAIALRIAELELEAAEKHPDRSPVEWCWLASQEWNDLQHEAAMLEMTLKGQACALRRERRFWKTFLASTKTETTDYSAPSVLARVGNITIQADHHGMGFTCSIDGQPVKRLRSVCLTLEIDKPNLVTVEVLCDHRPQPTGETHAPQDTEEGPRRPASAHDRHPEDRDGE